MPSRATTTRCSRGSILAYPSGRLASRSSRAVVGALFGVLAVRTVFRIAIIRPTTEYGDLTDPAVADRYVSDVTLRADGDAVFSTIIAILAIAVVVLVIDRWRAQTAAGRRVAGPILLGGLAFAIGIVVEYATGFVPTTNIFDRFAIDDLGQYLTVATATLVPIGFLVGLTRARIARGGVADLVLQLGAKPGSTHAPGSAARRRWVTRLSRSPTRCRGRLTSSTVTAERSRFPQPLTRTRAVTRLERDGDTVALLIHDPALMEQPELLGSVVGGDAPGARQRAARRPRSARSSRRSAHPGPGSWPPVTPSDAESSAISTTAPNSGSSRWRWPSSWPESQAGRSDPASCRRRSTGPRPSWNWRSAELRELARGLHPTVLDRGWPGRGGRVARGPFPRAGQRQRARQPLYAGTSRRPPTSSSPRR